MGSGNCVDVASQQFDQSKKDGLVTLKSDIVSVEDLELVRDAVTLCPVGAIILTEIDVD